MNKGTKSTKLKSLFTVYILCIFKVKQKGIVIFHNMKVVNIKHLFLEIRNISFLLPVHFETSMRQSCCENRISFFNIFFIAGLEYYVLSTFLYLKIFLNLFVTPCI